MDYVENCEYNNLSLSRIVVKVFSLKALLNIYGNDGIYSMGKDVVEQI